MRYLITLYANYKLAKIENLKRGRLGIYTLYNEVFSLLSKYSKLRKVRSSQGFEHSADQKSELTVPAAQSKL